MVGLAMAIATKKKSIFEGIPEAPPDPILSLTAAYQVDPSENKLNLGVGAYRTDEGKPYVLPVVKEVEKILVSRVLCPAVRRLRRFWSDGWPRPRVAANFCFAFPCL